MMATHDTPKTHGAHGTHDTQSRYSRAPYVTPPVAAPEPTPLAVRPAPIHVPTQQLSAHVIYAMVSPVETLQERDELLRTLRSANAARDMDSVCLCMLRLTHNQSVREAGTAPPGIGVQVERPAPVCSECGEALQEDGIRHVCVNVFCPKGGGA